ncbi:hypothetical protein BDK51DRAFT_21218, partial [Blyttiomyces helicus]
ILARLHPIDETTNLTPTIIAKTTRRLHLDPSHPLGILKRRIESHFSSFLIADSLDPVVSTTQNFDDLLFPADHPGRARTDTYYVNATTVLRTHTSAHQRETLSSRRSDGYLLSADVYRRDEVDTSHYPVFHQMEGIRTFDRVRVEEEVGVLDGEPTVRPASAGVEDCELSPENGVQVVHSEREAELVGAHLKRSLERMVQDLFGADKNLRVRWIEGSFPFTSPSWEMEVFYEGKWLEILGCGVVQQKIMDQAGNSDRVGWAFGLGLERIAMVLFNIPDIRLFWTTDDRFRSQFTSGQIVKFQPYSKYPACYKDVSFWCPDEFHENDFAEVVREVAGDLAESVALIDEFRHPKTHKTSRCYRINYRSMDR